jgi:predicted transcriptional regulator of viral defense system
MCIRWQSSGVSSVVDIEGTHGVHSMDRAVIAAAARFHRVVTTEQLRAVGLGRSAIAYRVRKGWLTRMFRGVYRVGAFDDRWTREAAALLACGDAAVLSHASAAAVWGIRAHTGGPVDITVARGHRAGQDGIAVHRSPLKRSEVRTRCGLRVTSPARTLHDLATTLSPEDLDRTVNEAQVLNLTTAKALLAHLARSSRLAGAPALREALREQPRPNRSKLECDPDIVAARIAGALARPLTNAR